MKNLKLKSLLAAAVLLSSASAFAVQVTLITDGLYSASGTFYNKIKVDTATWNWDGAVLTQTGSLSSTQSVGPSPLLTDNTTGMVIDTTANTTTATSYTCTEGTFLGGVGAHGCWNLSLGGDFVLNSTAAYNVGGDANCVNVTVLGDDVAGGGPRTPGTASGGSCDPQGAMAYANWNIALDNTGVSGGFLIISSTTIAGCAGGTTKNAACGDTTYMKLQAIPVPAAVWLFGSGLGLLGLARRRMSASA
ncbi:MAG: hypothetical protein OEV14_06955 [Gammaproteobacteria bacterium]|nr:hypothetical protein [Gammaproteobacteria bacterium]